MSARKAQKSLKTHPVKEVLRAHHSRIERMANFFFELKIDFQGGSLQQIPMGFVEQNPWTPKHVKTASIVQSQANRRRNAYQDPDENDDEDSVGSHLAPLEDVTTPVQSTKVLGPSSKYRSNVSSQHSMDQDKSGDFLGGSGSQRMKGRGSGKNGVAPGIRSLDVEADFEDTPMGSKKSSCANTGLLNFKLQNYMNYH